MMTISFLFLLASVAVPVSSLNNGFTLPAIGYSTWNDCSSFRDNGADGWCWDSEAHIKNITLYMISSGLAKLGYNRVNVDEGWLLGRNATTGEMYEDLSKFPSGMKALGTWITSQETYPGSNEYMHYGLYSCRGTCQCGTSTYSAPGSNGHEMADVDWMVAQGADYLKIDSCCGNQNHQVAFSDYAKFRDAMNATGKQVWFSLCGWEDWYSPPDPSLNYTGGASLGNSWRIAGDGSGWGPLTNCMNTQAGAAPYAGMGGWPDPDLLIGPKVYVGGQTDEQARAQFTMWSLFPTNLLISQNMLQWSDYALETYSNAELIAINQDPLGSPARRLVGGDLKFPCHSSGSKTLAEVQAAKCDPGNAAQQWSWDGSSGSLINGAFPGGALDVSGCDSADGTPVVITAKGQSNCANSQHWVFPSPTAGSTVTNTGVQGKCLDVFDWTGPAADVWECNTGTNQVFTLSSGGLLQTSSKDPLHPTPMCLQAMEAAPGSCTNTWGRALAGGDYALGLVNNAVDGPLTVTCDSACFAELGVTKGTFTIRDLWAHANIGTLTGPPYTFSSVVNASGFANAFRFVKQ